VKSLGSWFIKKQAEVHGSLKNRLRFSGPLRTKKNRKLKLKNRPNLYQDGWMDVTTLKRRTNNKIKASGQRMTDINN